VAVYAEQQGIDGGPLLMLADSLLRGPHPGGGRRTIIGIRGRGCCSAGPSDPDENIPANQCRNDRIRPITNQTLLVRVSNDDAASDGNIAGNISSSTLPLARLECGTKRAAWQALDRVTPRWKTPTSEMRAKNSQKVEKSSRVLPQPAPSHRIASFQHFQPVGPTGTAIPHDEPLHHCVRSSDRQAPTGP
jgi:hypothetical protein